MFAQDGTLRRNPDLDARLELVVRTSEGVRSVVGQLEGTDQEVAGVDQGGGRFLLTFELGALGDGEYTLIAQGEGAGVVVEPARRTLRIGRNGVQHTAFDEVGTALSPQLHRLDEGLALTWTDRRNDLRRLYLQYLGADLRPLGEPVALTDAELTVSRAAVAYDGEGRLGVLMQTLEGEGRRQNRVMVVSLEGEELMAPVSIDPEDAVGRPGGGRADGAFQVVARSAAPGRRHPLGTISAEGIDVRSRSAQETQPIEIALHDLDRCRRRPRPGFKRERYCRRRHASSAITWRSMRRRRAHRGAVDPAQPVGSEVSLHRAWDTVVPTTPTSPPRRRTRRICLWQLLDAEGSSRWRPLLRPTPLDLTNGPRTTCAATRAPGRSRLELRMRTSGR